MILGGTTLFINSDDVKKIAQDGELHDFPGVIVARLSRPTEKIIAISKIAQRNIIRQLKEAKLIPEGCAVKVLAIGLDDKDSAGLVVNYQDA